jgi:hypothetical protein
VYNTWDYKVGDLIQVEKLGWPAEIGVVIRFQEQGRESPRKYWEWVSASTGRTMYFFEIKSELLAKDHKIKVLARGEDE